MGKRIAVIGTLDSKGIEFKFVKQEIERRGHTPIVIDTSVMGEPAFLADIPRERVAEAGGERLVNLQARGDRGHAMEIMSRGITNVIKDLYDRGEIDAVFGMGGSAGTVLGTAAMQALPVGFPKVMVSTLASGDTRSYVRTKDIVMIPSVVDVAGINRISARIYANAVGAIVGMVETATPQIQEKQLLATSMFGNTTPIVNRCREAMEQQGYEVLVFHATGTGGQTMENLIEEGYFSGVLDITTTEWADELVGGVLSAGPTRLDAAAKRGVPQVIVPGCLDMVNFWAPETIPEKFKERKFYKWNPNVTLMRTTPEENMELGRILAEKANRSTGPVAFMLPLKGVSMLDAPGKEFWWPEADIALFKAIKQYAHPGIEIHELDFNINDEAFADAVSKKMLEFLSAAMSERR